MQKRKQMLVGLLSALLIGTVVFAGDIEMKINGATDAVTIDKSDGSEAMRVTADGKVGIGTTTPTEKLHVEGNIRAKSGYGTYQEIFTIGGSSSKYYPIRINTDQNSGHMAEINISRYYGWTAPKNDPNWNNSTTHFGGLTLNVDFQGNAWGGMPALGEVNHFGERYSSMVGKIARSCHGKCMIVWLKGGTAQYEINANYVLDVLPCETDSCLVYDHPNDIHDITLAALDVGNEVKPTKGQTF